jgi:hypothetical protein
MAASQSILRRTKAKRKRPIGRVSDKHDEYAKGVPSQVAPSGGAARADAYLKQEETE